MRNFEEDFVFFFSSNIVFSGKFDWFLNFFGSYFRPVFFDADHRVRSKEGSTIGGKEKECGKKPGVHYLTLFV